MQEIRCEYHSILKINDRNTGDIECARPAIKTIVYAYNIFNLCEEHYRKLMVEGP